MSKNETPERTYANVLRAHNSLRMAMDSEAGYDALNSRLVALNTAIERYDALSVKAKRKLPEISGSRRLVRTTSSAFNIAETLASLC